MTGAVPATPLAPAYRVALPLVAAWMVLLPILYAALVAGAAAGTALWAWWAGPVLVPRGAIAAVLYVTPLAAGVFLVVILARPLLPARSTDGPPRVLRRDEAPGLHALVETVAAAVGAPPPREIRVDLDVNASASFRRGVWSLPRRGDLVLTVGLPLVRGLDARGLAGIVAHEMGHFRQGGAMRLRFVILTVSSWFARAVHERTRWDAQVEGASRSGSGYAKLIAWSARGAVAAARGLLGLLLRAGVAASARLSRAMEFDADLRETFVAGSGTFGLTQRRIFVLTTARAVAGTRADELWSARRRVDDLAVLGAAVAEHLPIRVREAIDRALREGVTGRWDSHPCDRERIAAAEALAAPGFVDLDAPAAALFTDPDALGRELTGAVYRGLAADAEAAPVLRAQDLAAEHARDVAALDAFLRYFGGAVSRETLALPAIGAAGSPPDVAACRAAVAAGRALVEGARRAATSAADDAVAAAATRLVELRTVRQLVAAGVSPGPEWGDLAARGLGRVTETLAEAQAALDGLRRDAAPTSAAHGARLASALALLGVPEIRGGTRDGEAHAAAVAALQPSYDALRAARETLRDLSCETLVARAAIERMQGVRAPDSAYAHLDHFGPHVVPRLRALRAALAVAPPPGVTTDAATLADHVVPAVPPEAQWGAVIGAASAAVERAYACEVRVVARLAEAAEAVEEAIGLPPLPVPPAPQDAPPAIVPPALHGSSG